MFSETIFKPSIVAVREITQSNSDTVFVKIYRRRGQIRVPELVLTEFALSRPFTENMAAAIRHSTNWINKLDRENGSEDFWDQETDEWGTGPVGSTKIFFLEPAPALVDQFIARVESPSRSFNLDPVIQAFQEAMSESLPIGSVDRERLGRTFVSRLREATTHAT